MQDVQLVFFGLHEMPVPSIPALLLFSTSTKYLTPPAFFVVKLEHAQHFFLSRQFIFKSTAKNAVQYILKQMFLVIISIIFQPLHRKYYSQHHRIKTNGCLLASVHRSSFQISTIIKNCCNKNLDTETDYLH